MNVTTKETMNSQTFQRGDVLSVCAKLSAASFHLVYADPPYFSGKIRSKQASPHHYDDRWDSLEDYLEWLERTIAAQHRLLAPSGVFVLHLDWRAVHYAKVRCDAIFGYDNFINEIVWSYRTGGLTRRALARKHDTLLAYGRSADYTFHPQLEKSYLAHDYGFSNITLERDERGTYRMANMRDVWDIPALRGNQPEATDYPTQKPVALLWRLIELFSSPNDLVGDFFCGSGTTAVAAQSAGRRFFTSDRNPAALRIARKRVAELANH